MTSATRRDLRGAATTFTYAAGRLLPGRADYTGLSRSWRHDVLAVAAHDERHDLGDRAARASSTK